MTETTQPIPDDVLAHWLAVVRGVPRLAMPIRGGYGGPYEPHDVLTELGRRGLVRQVALTRYYSDWEAA